MPSKYSKTALTFFVTMNNKTRLNGPRHSAEVDGWQTENEVEYICFSAR
jgi:hypothetical protein